MTQRCVIFGLRHSSGMSISRGNLDALLVAVPRMVVQANIFLLRTLDNRMVIEGLYIHSPNAAYL